MRMYTINEMPIEDYNGNSSNNNNNNENNHINASSSSGNSRLYRTRDNSTNIRSASSDNSASVTSAICTITTTSNNRAINSQANTLHCHATATGIADHSNDLKIIDHLRNIEKISEKRRIFLTNTIRDCTPADNEINSKDEVVLPAVNTQENRDQNKKQHHRFDSTSNSNNMGCEISTRETPTAQEASPLKSSLKTSGTTSKPPPAPTMKPPPKPPMLSRVRSIGNGDQIRSADTTRSVDTAIQSASTSAASSATETALKTTATITTIAPIKPEPVKITTIQLKEDSPILRRIERLERPMSMTPTSSPKHISVNHYERLIEELKCPGCSYPMKAPILLCKTGHAVCEQCTRILMMCPLCKETFTDLRCRTVEALCSKAHFRCSNAAGGCTVRLQNDLLTWHEKQCIFKPMRCFMGRVWGDCQWSGREAHWKDHLETEHANRVFHLDNVELIWNMGIKQKPLTGYYVFEIYNEMFNFYEVYDKERVLFTMACTSTIKEKKHNYAFEVTIIHPDNEALAITQKFPVHSEYDQDILAEGTCVNIPLTDLAKFIDDDRLLHYCVRIVEVKSPRNVNYKKNNANKKGLHPIDFQQTQIEGVNLKNVPANVILTRKEAGTENNAELSSSTSALPPPRPTSSTDDENEQARLNQYRESSDSDPEFDAYIAKIWGTPQMNFNRKFLNAPSDSSSSNGDPHSYNKNAASASATLGRIPKKAHNDDGVSIASTSYKKRVTNTLRKSFRSLNEIRPFGRKSPEKKSPEKN